VKRSGLSKKVVNPLGLKKLGTSTLEWSFLPQGKARRTQRGGKENLEKVGRNPLKKGVRSSKLSKGGHPQNGWLLRTNSNTQTNKGWRELIRRVKGEVTGMKHFKSWGNVQLEKN